MTDDQNHQHVLTIFPHVLQNVVNIEGKSEDEIEDLLLDLEAVDFVYNKKYIVVSMASHEKL